MRDGIARREIGLHTISGIAARAPSNVGCMAKDGLLQKRWFQVVCVAAAIAVFTVGLIGSQLEKRAKARAESAAPAKSELPITGDKLVSELEAKFADGKLFAQGTVEVTKFEEGSLTLKYERSSPTPVMTRQEAEVITMGLVKFSIDVLIEHGYNPRDRSMFVIAHAYQPAGKSVTGAGQVRTFGKAMYDYNEDRVTFMPASR